MGVGVQVNLTAMGFFTWAFFLNGLVFDVRAAIGAVRNTRNQHLTLVASHIYRSRKHGLMSLKAIFEDIPLITGIIMYSGR
jgi:hypothetical protein